MKPDSSSTAEQIDRSSKNLWVFTPSRSDPKDLEFILVQREPLLRDAVERVRESALTDHKHYLLFVGPRGCGKTHLVTLIVSRLGLDEALTDRLRIAWLNEDETCTTLLEFLFKIHSALEKRYPEEFHEETLEPAYDLKPSDALGYVSQHLLSSLGSRTLLVVTENLDAIFEGLGDSGQKQLRAFLQEHSQLAIVATAQRLVEDLSSRASPFFGFFQTEHLKTLSFQEATQLLQNIARLQEKAGLVEFLATSRGRSRVRALHHLSGGNHRIYIVLSQFITRDNVDALLVPFMKMVDELTPYYQERIRWLAPLQRKIVEYLCASEGTVPVKEIAKKLFATPQTISKQLQDLREKGYVEANQRGRESLYEISEPLMRICVEVKENQTHEPLRLLVDFLRVWYDDPELKLRLGKMERTSAHRAYLESAIQKNIAEGNLRKQIFLADLQSSLSQRTTPLGCGDLLEQLESLPEVAALAIQCLHEGNDIEARKCLDEAITEESVPFAKAALLLFSAELHARDGELRKALEYCSAVNDLRGSTVEQTAEALFGRGFIHVQMGELQFAIEDYSAILDLQGLRVEQVAEAFFNRGFTRDKTGELRCAIDDYSAAIALKGAPIDQVVKALINRGLAHGQLGESRREIADYSTVIDLHGAPIDEIAKALLNRGFTYGQLGDLQRKIDDYSAVIEIKGIAVDQIERALFGRGFTYGQLGDLQREIDDYSTIVELQNATVEQISTALFNRGFTYGQLGDLQREIDDYSTVIELPGAPTHAVAKALYNRGISSFDSGNEQQSQSDFETLISLPSAPEKEVVMACLALSTLHFSEGRWSKGFDALKEGLRNGERAKPVYFLATASMIGRIFSAGMSPSSRNDKVSELFRLYQEHKAAASLGEAIVQHIGRVYIAGEPFPSVDNLEDWAAAWERAAENVPEFRLSIRLLRTGIEFVKTRGKDPGTLLNLASSERAILEQAFGLALEDQATST